MEVKIPRSKSRSNMESKVKSFRPQRQRLGHDLMVWSTVSMLSGPGSKRNSFIVWVRHLQKKKYKH